MSIPKVTRPTDPPSRISTVAARADAALEALAAQAAPFAFDGVPTPVGSASTAEAVIAELEIPGLAVGDRLGFDVSAISTGSNSTDTHTVRVRLGSLTGPVVAQTAATDVANDDIARLDGALKVVAVGAAGVAQVAGSGRGQYSTATAGAATAGHKGTVSAQYGTAPLKLVVTGQVSASNAANAITLLDLSARAYRK